MCLVYDDEFDQVWRAEASRQIVGHDLGRQEDDALVVVVPGFFSDVDGHVARHLAHFRLRDPHDVEAGCVYRKTRLVVVVMEQIDLEVQALAEN